MSQFLPICNRQRQKSWGHRLTGIRHAVESVPMVPGHGLVSVPAQCLRKAILRLVTGIRPTHPRFVCS